MKIVLKDFSGRKNKALKKMISEFVPYTQSKLGYEQPFTIKIVSDVENSQEEFGRTAYYSPEDMEIVLYVDGRHDKDILRSLSHEIIHHSQNCAGRMNNSYSLGEDYAQTNKDMRKLEAEAYLLGNGLLFRDYEDSKKDKKSMKKSKLTKEALIKALTESIKIVEARQKKSSLKKKNKALNESKDKSKSVTPEDTAAKRGKTEKAQALFQELIEKWSK